MNIQMYINTDDTYTVKQHIVLNKYAQYSVLNKCAHCSVSDYKHH